MDIENDLPGQQTKSETVILPSLQNKINELSIPILNSITKQQIDNFKFFNQRHYEDRFHASCNKQGQYEDVCIRVHTNKLLLITLASGNDIIQSGRNIVEISFKVNNGDRSRIRLAGKRKLGAKPVHPDTIMCRIKLEGEDDFRNIRAGVTGYLLEINESVKKDPNLLKTDPKCYGYLAIVMPKGPINEQELNAHNRHLINEEQYLDMLRKRNC